MQEVQLDFWYLQVPYPLEMNPGGDPWLDPGGDPWLEG